MTRYITKQRTILLTYLNEHPDELLSVKQITDALSIHQISASAVYRNLADLEQEGKVTRSAQNGSREVFFQFIGAPDCKGHLHMHCNHCGRTYHMDEKSAEALRKTLLKNDAFALDIRETVIYGICESCKGVVAHE